MKYITLLMLMSIFYGCTSHDDSIKTSNCSAKFEYNCNCDSECTENILVDTVKKASKIVN